ncbi:hypothetical protein NLX83_09930 [Allokutzneria sp. A3M-2-11 16]|uniref:hypothetical protein n=1 Tax=Allokutzneria sp. A3M-2-11 16 TaxID=2962043 RepID=UPI0020B6A98A|nr:hypothetical protein [Allokutzneria sp. A3M-2-11 16]MCP3799574.1 hypothetical protein [Allokutzneria sp. A3M-2-11 16]
MSWQEELRSLDAELAAGNISADQYRQRRDHLLAQASAAGPTPKQPEPSSGDGPFPPPFRWENSAPAETETTQIIQPVKDEPAAEPKAEEAPAAEEAPKAEEPPADATQVVAPSSDATQVVSPVGDNADRTQVVSTQHNAGDADRTQVVPGAGQPLYQPQQQPFPGQQQQQMGSPWPAHPQHQPYPQQQPHGSTPPWASNDLPPDFGSTSAWPRQGPEVFESNSGSKVGKIVAIVAVVLLLVGGGLAIWYFTSNNGGETPPVASSSAPPPAPTTTTPPPKPKPKGGQFVDLDGTLRANMAHGIDSAVAANVPTPDEVKVLKEAGATEVLGYGTEDKNVKLGLWEFKASGDALQKVFDEIDKMYANAGFQPYTGAGTPESVKARVKTDASGGATYRAHYKTATSVVRVEAFGPDGPAAETAFKALMERQLKQYPPA